nr:hypothetical protein [Salinibacterium sp. NG253]
MGESGPSTQRCSRAGCTAPAQWNVNWRNPRIHGLERVKVWLACADHVDYLREYLTTRNFPVVVSDLSDDVSVVPDGSGA